MIKKEESIKTKTTCVSLVYSLSVHVHGNKPEVKHNKHTLWTHLRQQTTPCWCSTSQPIIWGWFRLLCLRSELRAPTNRRAGSASHTEPAGSCHAVRCVSYQVSNGGVFVENVYRSKETFGFMFRSFRSLARMAAPSLVLRTEISQQLFDGTSWNVV